MSNAREHSEVEVEDLRRELDAWKRIAFYLADCHAATAEGEGMLKRTSKSSKQRFVEICLRAVQMLEHPLTWVPRERNFESVIERCRGVKDLAER